MLPPTIHGIPKEECGEISAGHEEHLWVSKYEFMGVEEYQPYICSGLGEL